MLYIVAPDSSIFTKLHGILLHITFFCVAKCSNSWNETFLIKVELNPLVFVVFLKVKHKRENFKWLYWKSQNWKKCFYSLVVCERGSDLWLKCSQSHTSAHHVCPRIAVCFGACVGYFADDAVITSSFTLVGAARNSCFWHTKNKKEKHEVNVE